MNPIEEMIAAIIDRGFVGDAPPRPYTVAREVIEPAVERVGLGIGNGLERGIDSVAPVSDTPAGRDPEWIIVDADGNSILPQLRGFGGLTMPVLVANPLCDALNDAP